MQLLMHPLETRLEAAKAHVDGSTEAATAAAQFELAQAAWEAGRPSVAEPLLRTLSDEPDTGMASTRLLAELLVATSRPAEAVDLIGRLDDSGPSQIVSAWLSANHGDDEAGRRALAALDAISAPSMADTRLAHQAAAVCPVGEYPAALFEWIRWLRDNRPEDTARLEDVEAWTVALEIATALRARPAQLHDLPTLLLSLALPLPGAHPVRARAFLASGAALADTNPEISIVLLDEVRRNLPDTDPLLREDLERRLTPLEQFLGRPVSTLITPGLRALILISKSGLALASGLDEQSLDLHVCLMKSATARDFLLAASEPVKNWTGDAVGLSLQASADGTSGLLTFSAVHPESTDLVISLDRSHLDAIAAFAQGHGLTPAFAGAVGRNDACPCGSGRKYKRCCGA